MASIYIPLTNVLEPSWEFSTLLSDSECVNEEDDFCVWLSQKLLIWCRVHALRLLGLVVEIKCDLDGDKWW